MADGPLEAPARAAGLTYRHAGPDDAGSVALMLHGFPESSVRWQPVLDALPDGWRGIAPDLPGFGDSPPDRPSTWERQVERVEEFRQALGLDRLVLCADDWGGLIGLRWACEHPEAVRALVLSSTGFFADGKWHGMAETLRTPGEGEALLEAMTPDVFRTVLRQAAPTISDAVLDEYWKCLADADRCGAILELYRSGDFAKLEPYEGRLAAIGAPTLLLWGEDDAFAPVAGAIRFERELPDARLVVLEGVGHFSTDDAPERVAAEVRSFLTDLPADG